MDKTGLRSIIGGEFEITSLHWGDIKSLRALSYHIDGTWTMSGRSALMLILQRLKKREISHIHLPSFLCESIVMAVLKSGIDYSFYKTDNFLRAHPSPKKGTAILLIHYFGWENSATKELRAEAGKSFYLIEDACQALLSNLRIPCNRNIFAILSPRKFAPTVAGGWCNVRAKSEKPNKEVELLIWKSLAARLARGNYLADSTALIDKKMEDFYLGVFNDVESYLNLYPGITFLPHIVLNIIAGIDWQRVANKRRENWKLVHGLLAEYVESFAPELPEDVVPLGYVVKLKNRDKIRRKLAERRIFCPVHWVLPRQVNRRDYHEAASLSERLLTLPIDQRYEDKDMYRIAEALKELI